MLATKDNETIPSEAPHDDIHSGACDADEAAVFGGSWPEVTQLRPGADEIMVRNLRADIACQQEIVEQYREISVEIEKLVNNLHWRGVSHDQLIQAKLLSAIQQRRLAEAQADLASLREQLATAYASRAIRRRPTIERERAPPLTASH